ncbi:MAG: alpha,alpha-trehalase TreF [Sphingopyxis sp.]|nr:alpha,alpha-trehalase TreF [Sphingopyxis sp.]
MPKPKQADATPAELYGPLLARVQERGILADGKTFVDAVPTRPIVDIMADFALLPSGDAALLRFVADNFRLPSQVDLPQPSVPTQPLRAHIRSMWSSLARDPQSGILNSSALPVGHRHVVPGGRFREIYYWDSFFSMLGLVRDGEAGLATGIVDAMTDLIEDHGHVPNGTRTYYLGRSQPPLFHMMVALLDDARPEVARRRLAAMKREHGWWMEGADELDAGTCANRVARLADGSLLNRYWDPRGTPRDESWREDVATAAGSDRPADDVYRDLRAGAESGWDFSSRWLDGASLSSIRTTAIAPIDLNAFLFGLETAIAAAGDGDAALFAGRAALRRDAINRHLWDADSGQFLDYDIERARPRPNLSAAALAPLLSGVATQAQADAIARFTSDRLLAPGGLRTTLIDSGQQWDNPNGWAPLQWIAVAGLRRYGHHELAGQIAARWIATVEATYAATGLLYEKYNIESPSVGRGGEYDPQIGFGWTNGVTAEFIDDAGADRTG